MFFTFNQQNYVQMPNNGSIFQQMQMPNNTIIQTSTEMAMNHKMTIYKNKLISYLKQQESSNHYIDLHVIKKYYSLPFDSLPSKEEILQISQKISQRSLF